MSSMEWNGLNQPHSLAHSMAATMVTSNKASTKRLKDLVSLSLFFTFVGLLCFVLRQKKNMKLVGWEEGMKLGVVTDEGKCNKI